MAQQVFLVGNDINNVSSEYNWRQLIEDLISHLGIKDMVASQNKPFPLLYEEVFLKALRHRKRSENDLKAFIASKVLSLKPNDVHIGIVESKPAAILTTNYDYTLELAQGALPHQLTNLGKIKENKYSVFRHHIVSPIEYWHIHGEANHPASITLGYEHYSGYLQQMRNYVVTGTTSSSKDRTFISLNRRLKDKKISSDSWLDYFFTSNCYIFGLTLDFVEIHLWWLIAFRARAKFEKRMPIKNAITFFYPTSYESKIAQRLELLKSCGITPVSIPYDLNNRAKYYQNVLHRIKNGD